MKLEFEAAWNRFWFSPVSHEKTARFRVAAASVAFIYFVLRHFYLSEFYFDDGILTLAKSKTIFGGVFHSPLFWFPSDPLAIHALHGLFLVSLATLALGVFPRVSAALALYIHVLFLNRNFLPMYGFDKIVSCWLFYLMFMKPGGYFTVFRSQTKSKLSSDLLTPAAVRMAQLHLCVVYAYSGLEKMRGQGWWNGEALWGILANGIVAPFDMGFMAHLPWLVYAGTYSTVLWEIYFPLAIWVPALRKPWLFFGVVFHLMTALMMNLIFFAAIMLAGYQLFWDRESKD
ncbi:MAG: HTTM domain-containing protein [Bdellovibrionia bacterium]